MAGKRLPTAWERCAEAGCRGASATGAPGGLCLAHLADEEVVALVAGARRTRPLDGRGALVPASLLARMVAAAPLDDQGRPILPPARFDEARFSGAADFTGVVIGPDSTFDKATFEAGADFSDAVFAGQARFGRATFERATNFERASFRSHAWFAAARFGGDTGFANCTFAGPAWFGGADFRSDATFASARFAADGSFDETAFGCHTFFTDAVFGGAARFAGARFANAPRWDRAEFLGPGGAPPDAARRVAWSGAPPASWGTRAAAAALDHGAAVAIAVVGLVAGTILNTLHFGEAAVGATGLGLVLAVAFLARNLIEQGSTGQTFGKRHLGLCLVRRRDGLPVGPGRSVVRQVVHLLDTAPAFVGWLWPLWDRDHQTFADKAMATIVVRGQGWASSAAEATRSAAMAFA